MPIVNAQEWDDFLLSYPDANLLQTTAWGELKSGFGWYPVRVKNERCGAQILFRGLPLGYTIAYIPKGPVGNDWHLLWDEIDSICKAKKAIFLKIEPDIWEAAKGEELSPEVNEMISGLDRMATRTAPIQPQRTSIINLSGDQDDWLKRMKQKTRYNIRLADKKEVTVKISHDPALFYEMMKVTGERDGFGVHSLSYYQKAYELFCDTQETLQSDGKPLPTGASKGAIIQAEYDNKPLSALMILARGANSWYMYGSSTNEERNRMPTYIMQWEAMKWAAKYGCKYYDLWGLPDADEEELEANFTKRSDGLWGVYRFKRGFGADIMRSVGAWDKIYQPLLYQLYRLYTGFKNPEN